MKVYVMSVQHVCPEVDGQGYVIGVFTTEEKVKETEQKYREYERDWFDPLGRRDVDEVDEVDDLYEIIIDEFEIE